jgi:hypothetical protein
VAWDIALHEVVALCCRYFGESPPSRFIDLCTVSKVSLLLLPDRYHGYYLHCDAAYEVCD